LAKIARCAETDAPDRFNAVAIIRSGFPESVGHAEHALPVRMIKLTDARQIAPYKWVHPDEERENAGMIASR
jgi:hypothetical protein